MFTRVPVTACPSVVSDSVSRETSAANRRVHGAWVLHRLGALEAASLIELSREKNFLVQMGHSDASFEQAASNAAQSQTARIKARRITVCNRSRR